MIHQSIVHATKTTKIPLNDENDNDVDKLGKKPDDADWTDMEIRRIENRVEK